MPLLKLAWLALATAAAAVKPSVNFTSEYPNDCKTCPYGVCVTKYVVDGNENVTATCFTNGSTRGDTNIWFYIKQGCYVNEYGFNEYKDGDITEDLEYCGQIPVDIYREPAQVRYLSECKAGTSTAEEDVQFYGRDQDITITCSTKGLELLGNNNWYKTVDDCFVSETGLWAPPDRKSLPDCGPQFPGDSQTKRHRLSRRYLISSLVGEEYAPCYTCPKTTCGVTKTYEFNDTVISQCQTDTKITKPDGTIQEDGWVLTTDWCYVNETLFWDYPASYNYKFPHCNSWKGYE